MPSRRRGLPSPLPRRSSSSTYPGLAAAQQLARAGYEVSVFERDEKPGGLLRYGIPDFKLEKHVLDRRLEQLKAEGVKFHTGVNAGVDISAHYLQKMYNAICITMGACQARDLPIPGRELPGGASGLS